MIQMEKSKKKNPKKRIAVIMTVVCIMVMVSLAWWYYHTKRPVKTEGRDVMVPYYLYLLNEDQSDYFQLQVVNMHPGETKRCVVCVSNKDKSDSGLTYSVGRESEFQYELGFSYTQNIPLDYSVYELKKITLGEDGKVTDADKDKDLVYMESGSVWEKVKNTGNQQVVALKKKDNSEEETEANNKEMYGASDINSIVNVGQYDTYTKDANENEMKLKISYSNNEPVFEYDYYLVEITWKEAVTNFIDYLKETDLVYVTVKAEQPKPEEKKENGNG